METYLFCNPHSFSSPCIIFCLPREVCIDNPNMILRQFILLFWSRTCYELPMYVCCGKCHRSLRYEITTQFPVFSLSCFFSLVAWLSLCLLLSLKPALENAKTWICSVSVLRRNDVFFFFPPHRILHLFSSTYEKNKTIVAICVKQMVIQLSYYWIL